MDVARQRDWTTVVCRAPDESGGGMSGPPLRIVVVDDHELFRRGVRALVSTMPDMEVVAEAPDGISARAVVEQHDPDLVLMDLQMPGGSGLEAIRRSSRGVRRPTSSS